MAESSANRATTRKVVLAVGLILMALLTLVRGQDPEPVREVREVYFDYLQRISPRDFTPLPVRVVDIDETSLEQFGQWPWPRDRLAQLLARLGDYGAAVVAFDVIFAEPDRLSPSAIISRMSELDLATTSIDVDKLAALDTDLKFAEAIAGSQVVLGIALTAGQPVTPPRAKAGFVEIGANPGASAPPLLSSSPILPPLRQAAQGIGAISVAPKADSSVVRKVPLVWNSAGGYYPTLALEALRLALGESTFALQGASDIDGFLETISVGDLIIPTLPDGQLWIRYRRDHPDLYVSARDVLSADFDPEVADRIAGNIVLIGTSAAGLVDIRTTALRQNVAGVSIHAQMIEQILLGDHLVRHELMNVLEIVAFVVLGVIVLSIMTWFGPVASISAGAAMAAIFIGASWYAFSRFGVLFDATYPVIGGFLAFSGLAAYQFIVADHDKRLIRKSFSHYVAPGILDRIESTGHQLGLGGVNRTITVMFCDIRNFTPLSESMSANDVVSMLNELFTALGGRILGEDGTIDKFIGDAIMAFWNAPVESEHHRRKAAMAALQMRQALRGFNEGRQQPVAIAMGISSGIACVGNIGSRDRFNYSAIGDTVNVAARIEAACRHVDYDILLSDHAAAGVQDFAMLEAGHLELKGKSQRTRTLVLVGDETMVADPRFREMHDLYESLLDDLLVKGTLDTGIVARCCALAEQIEPGLSAYFQRLPARAPDFRAMQNASRLDQKLVV